MPITATDIKLLASERMHDNDDGGGPMVGTVLQDGADNNVFPDVSQTDRAFGRLQLRKVYAAVLPASGTDTLLGAHLVIQDESDDADVMEFAFASVSPAESRADAVDRLQVCHWEPLGPGGHATDSRWVDADTLHCTLFVPTAGMVIFTLQADGTTYGAPVLLTSVSALGGDDYDVTYHGTRVAGPTPTIVLGVPSTTSPRLSVCRPIAGSLAIGATYCDVDTLLARVVPTQPGGIAGAATVIGIDAVPVVPDGVALAIRTGDGLVVHHTATIAAANYTNGQTVDCGRTDVSVQVVDANGLGIQAGWTVNRATGIVTINDTSGWIQPVTIHHRIEEVLACGRTGYSEVSGGAVSSGANTQASGPFALAIGLEMYVGRPNVGRIRVISRSGLDITDRIDSSFFLKYFVQNLAAGTVTFVPSGSSSQYNAAEVASMIASHSPVTLVADGTYYAPSVPSDPQATPNRVTFNRALTRAFPAGSRLSNLLLFGDLQAQVGDTWSQETWTGVWVDQRVGNSIVAQYDDSSHPIEITDLGAITDRWAAIFTSSTVYRLVSETRGQVVATGNVASDLSPINPATGAPYFTLRAAGWGGGWSGGHVMRFNTRGAAGASWIARTVLPSPPNASPDSLLLAVRGDLNT